MQKPVIYQLLPRLFSNICPDCVTNGTIEQNGCGKLNHLNGHILNAIRSLGASHLWLTGVIEHATCTDYSSFGIKPDNRHVVKGLAGSPYAIKDYYDIDPDLAVDVNRRMEEFENAVKRIHHAGLKLIIDFVPNHVARQYVTDAAPADAPAPFGQGDRTDWFFARDNSFYYFANQPFAPYVDMGTGSDRYTEFPAKATGNDCFTPSPGIYDWYETVKLNYGIDYSDSSRHFDPIPATWHKMLHILLYWAAKGVDGFRCDMAHMVPVEFWHWAIARVKQQFPHVIFIAELYDVALYHSYIDYGGFDYLYDKVNLYDTLRAIETSGCPASAITSCWQTVNGLDTHMLNFLENHDEQRFASSFYAGDPFHVLPSLVVSATIGRGAMMIYAGQELGEQAADAEGYSGADGRTTIFDYWSIPTIRQWLGKNIRPADKNLSPDMLRLRDTYRRVLDIAANEPAVTDGEFFDLMYVNFDNPSLNPHNIFTYLRHTPEATLLIAVNFADSQASPEINIPAHAFEHLAITPGSFEAVELLSQRKESVTLSPDAPFRVDLAPKGAAIWKINHSRS